ncbi:MAG: hypothetical protein WC044_10950 [Crocinitomicaceae bacterium]
MTHKVIAIAIFSLIPLSFVAQKNKTKETVPTGTEFDYTLSKPYDVVDARTKNYFSQNGMVLTVKFQGKKCVLQKFDGTDQLNQITKQEFTDFEDGFVEEDIVQMAEHFYVFYSVWDRGNNKEQLFAREIDFEDCAFVGKGQKIIEVNGKVVGGFGAGVAVESYYNGFGALTFGNIGKKFKLKVSHDKSMVLISYKEVPEKKIDQINYDEIGLCVFNNILEEVSRQTVKMPVVESKLKIMDYAIDKIGNTYILAEIYHKGSKKKRFSYFSGKPKFDLELIKIADGKIEETRERLQVADGVINDSKFFIGPDNNLFIAGYYADKAWKMDKKATGMFYCRVESGSATKMVKSEIPLAVKNLYIKKRFQNRNTRKSKRGKPVNLYNLKPKELIFEKDNSVVLVGQVEYYIVQKSSGTGSMGGVGSIGGAGAMGSTIGMGGMGYNESSKTYYSKNIVVGKMESSGKLAWMTQIPKYQTGGEAVGGMGFKYISGNDGIYFLFLDNKKNSKLKENMVPYKHYDRMGGYLTAYKIDRLKGDLTRYSLFDVRKAKGVSLHQFATSRMIEIAPSQFALECYKKDKEDVMIQITIKE